MTMPVIGSSATTPAIPPDWFSVKDFGAIGDGSNDDTAAIQSAINALKATVGVVSGTAAGNVLYFPAGFYRVSAPLNFQNLTQVRVIGNDGSRSGGVNGFTPGTVINYVGGGAPDAVVDLRGSQAVLWDGVSVWASLSGFSGVLFSLDSLGAQVNIFGHRIQNCQIRATTGQPDAVLLSLAGNIETSIDNVNFYGGEGTQVRMVNPDALSTFSNANSFRSCSFQGDREVSILNPGPQTTLLDCTFESTLGIGGATAKPAPIVYNDAGNEPPELLSLVGCGFWDNTGSNGTGTAWIKSTVPTRTFHFAGTRFGINPNGYAIDLADHEGLAISACRFGTEGPGTSAVFNPAHDITNGSMLGSVASNGTVDNSADVFV